MVQGEQALLCLLNRAQGRGKGQAPILALSSGPEFPSLGLVSRTSAGIDGVFM